MLNPTCRYSAASAVTAGALVSPGTRNSTLPERNCFGPATLGMAGTTCRSKVCASLR